MIHHLDNLMKDLKKQELEIKKMKQKSKQGKLTENEEFGLGIMIEEYKQIKRGLEKIGVKK